MRSLAAVILAIGFASSASGQTGLRLVSTAWPPFTNAPGQTRFASDLVDEALKRIGFTAQTVIVDEAKFTPALLSREYDGSAAAWKDAERERALLFSDPYLENRLLLIGKKGSNVSARSLSALAGKRVVLVGGFSYGDAVTSKGGPTFIRSRSEEDSLAQLLAGQADYTLMDDLVVKYILDNYSEQARTRLAIGTTPLITRSLHLAIRKERIDAASIIKRFNDELRKMIVDRTYHRLLHVAWITADVDGDGRTELVAASDRAGTAPPSKSYDLFMGTGAASTATAKPGTPVAGSRFYVGGNIYETWASVPNRYKVEDPNWPDASRSTASIFKFTW
jgi:polar amino acid transport system substrate-binding protein